MRAADDKYYPITAFSLAITVLESLD